MSHPRQLDTPLYRLLHDEKISEFNKQKPQEGSINLRSADLRGIDLREANLEGASIAHAQISGAYFPAQLSADEILLSMQFGTRMRYS